MVSWVDCNWLEWLCSFSPGMTWNPSLLLCPSWIARNYGCEIVIIRWRIDNRYSKQSGQNFISFFYSESVLRLRNVSMKWSGARRRRGTKILGWQKMVLLSGLYFFLPTLSISDDILITHCSSHNLCGSLQCTISPSALCTWQQPHKKFLNLAQFSSIVSAKKLWDLQYPFRDITWQHFSRENIDSSIW